MKLGTVSSPKQSRVPARWAGSGSVAAVALLTGAVSVLDLRLALALALIPIAVAAVARPALPAILGVGLLILLHDVAGSRLPVRLAVADVLLALSTLGLLAGVVVGSRFARWGALRPLAVPIWAYAALLLIVLVAAPSVSGLGAAVQRVQIVVVPLLIGAFVLSSTNLRRGLSLYLVVSALFAFAYVLTLEGNSALGMQKNPAGHAMTVALLVATTGEALPRARFLCIPPLAIGLLSTGSRGAVTALIVGLLVVPLMRSGAARRRSAVALVPLALCIYIGYTLLPEDQQQRLGTVSTDQEFTGSLDSGEYTLALRREYREDALRIIAANPVTGVGLTQYLSGSVARNTLTDDPHNVLLLEAAEGGLPLAGGLVLLLGASVVVVYRRRHETPLAVAAVVVQTSMIVHGLVDVYWVRATPVMGWLLVGAALADAHRRRSP